jgi:hypothetical protein
LITVTLNRAASSAGLLDPGVSVVQLSPQIIFAVNVNGSAGKAFQATFYYSNNILPGVSGVFPNGSGMFQSTNTLTFNVTAPAGVSANGIAVNLNGALVTNLNLAGSPTNWNVSYPHLLPNTMYSLAVTVTDTNGNIATITNSFDTFNPLNYVVEAEDFDYGGGHFLDGPQTNAYAGLSCVTNKDAHQVNFGGTFLFRPNDMDTEVNGDSVRTKYQGTGFSDYSIGYFSPGSWALYTRHYPAGSYNVYARLATGGGATSCWLARVTGGWGSTSPVTNLLGMFSVPNTAWESYNYIPLKDSSGNLAVVTFSGNTNTLQLIRPTSVSGDCNANFLMFVPIFSAGAAPSGTNVAISFLTQPGFGYQVLYKTSLSDAAWLPLGSALSGDGTMQYVNDLPGATARFYQVQIQ